MPRTAEKFALFIRFPRNLCKYKLFAEKLSRTDWEHKNFTKNSSDFQ
jgi:hypothetical protein